MRAVRRLSASFDAPKSAPTASAIGYIIAVVAVFEIQSEMNAVASMTPNTTRRPPAVPTAVTMVYAMRA
jgi:hypothetical protein